MFFDAIDAGDVAAGEINPTTREAFRLLKDPTVNARFATFDRVRPAADRKAVIARYASAATLSPVVMRGQANFAKHCLVCHERRGGGPKVGPDLLAIAGRPVEDLIVAILDPARESAPDGLGFVAETSDGQVVSGLLVGETPSAVRIRPAGGIEQTIPRAGLESIRPTGRSLMPEGFEQVLTQQDLADLIGFLRGPGPTMPAAGGR
jgi:putative heme-binding domain-containing protein